MYFISATRLKLKSFIYLPVFFKASEASLQELLKTEGFITGKELMDKGLVFWTLTLWKNDNNMLQFRNSVPHRQAMQKLPNWGKEATYVHWLQEDGILPNWETVYEKMIHKGIVTKVRNPTKYHLSKDFPKIKWRKTERILK